jgi:ubiquitin C-terminal hydrolase
MNILNNNNKNQNISNNNDINQDILNNNINQNIPNNNNFINILNNNNQNISNNNNNIPNFSNNNNNQEIINNDNNQNLFNNNMNQNIPNNNNFMMKNNNINQNIQKNNNFFHNNQKNNAIQNIPGDNNQKNIQGNLNINNKKNNNLLAPAVPANTKYSFSRYTKAPLTGLINMGDTSYLNATLQIIGNLRNFASYFVNPINVMYIQNNYQTIPLSFVFQRLFYHLYPYPEKHDREKYKPEYVKNVIARKNKIYATNKRRNPNELISFILNNLHFELNKNKGNNQQFNIQINNKDNVIMYGCQNYVNKNNSEIFNLLNWFEIKEKRCSQCNNSTFHLNTFNIFELDILGAYSYRKNPITINDCLDLYSFLRQQTLFCITCRKYTKILNKSQIYSSPNTFIFSLDRKNLDQNYLNIPFNLTEKINLNNYIENKDLPTNYQLIGVLSFYVNENKYISFCLSPVDKKWYVYNDEKVEPTNINSIIQLHNFGKKFIPCLLVYKSVTQNS